MDSGDVFMNTINNLKDVTLFAPSNKAWMDANLANVIRDKERMSEILNLHIVRDRLTTDRIRQSNANSVRSPGCVGGLAELDNTYPFPLPHRSRSSPPSPIARVCTSMC